MRVRKGLLSPALSSRPEEGREKKGTGFRSNRLGAAPRAQALHVHAPGGIAIKPGAKSP